MWLRNEFVLACRSAQHAGRVACRSARHAGRVCGFWFAVAACNIINPAETVPSYLKVDSIALHADPNTEGSSTSKFTDVWVTVDGLVQGAYEMPAKFPLLFSGKHRIQLRAGVLLNGISGTRAPYAVLNAV